MQLAHDENDCIAYLMGNVTIAEQMFRHNPRAMLYAPLRTVIWQDSHARAWFTVEQPSTQFASFGIPAVSTVGVDSTENSRHCWKRSASRCRWRCSPRQRLLIMGGEKQSRDSRECGSRE